MADEAKAIKCQGVNLNNGFAGYLSIQLKFSNTFSLFLKKVHSFLLSLEGPNKFTILTTDKHDVTQLQIGFEGPAQPEVKLVTKKDKAVDVTFVTGFTNL